jgi:ABC-type iron transport system FetAB ATPase subunit
MLSAKMVKQDATQLVVKFQGLAVGGNGPEMRVVVPTPVTVSRQYVASLTLAAGGNPLVTGPSACGKSLMLQHLLAASPILAPTATHTMFNRLSVSSTGLEMQEDLMATLIRVHPTLLRPVIGRSAVMVVDDLHMPLQV